MSTQQDPAKEATPPPAGQGNDEQFQERPPAFEDLKYVVKGTLAIGARILRDIDRILTRINP